MKIHESRLSQQTKRELYHRLHSILSIELTEHCKARMTEKKISMAEICFATGGKIVEWHDDCLLLRSEGGVCVVVNLESGFVVTCYRNDEQDDHKTLDCSQYLFGVA